MKGWLAFAIGLLAVVVGAVWTLQGFGYLEGSAMTGETFWAVLGPIVALVGLFLIAVGMRSRGRRTPPT